MKKILSAGTTLISVIFLLIFPNPIFAQYNSSCPSVYGAQCPTGNISINKTIQNPQTGEYVDALSANGPNFLPGENVKFKIEVTNKGNSDLNNIHVTDKFPQFLEFVSGPVQFDSNSHSLSWTIDKLSPGDSQYFDITAKIASTNLPDVNISCITNFAEAQQDQQIAQDTVPFCFQTKVLGTSTTLPKTGPSYTEMIFGLSLFSLAAALLITVKLI